MTIEARQEVCSVCSDLMYRMYDHYHKCRKCGYMLSKETAGSGAEVIGVDDVRRHNFHQICNILKTGFPAVKTILDVGCAHGLFLEVAERYGLEATGIEPDPETGNQTSMRGYKVISGFFPNLEALAGKKFDAIIFNDSLEHIPGLHSVISGIQAHLNQHTGLAIVNIPTSAGLVYLISSGFRLFGIKLLIDRLWQKGFASPHIHYFNKRNLKLLFENNGFEMKHNRKLHYYTIKGLWTRLSCKSSFMISVLSWIALVVLYPLFLVKSDCFVGFFELKK